MKIPENKTLAKKILTAAGGISTTLGLLVLIGWYTNSVFLIQIHPTFVPMQYNTALGFLLSGLAMISFSIGYKKTSAVLGGVVALVGGLTLVEYIFGVDLGIDQMFMEHYVTVKTSHPGRMAPNTALSFLLTGLFFIVNLLKMDQQKKEFTRALFGSILFSLGIVAFFGYVLQLEAAYGWQKLTRMAIHTSFGFVILSIGILSRLFFGQIEGSKRSWLPVPLAFSVLFIFILFSQATHQQETKLIQEKIELEAKSIVEQMKSKLHEYEKVLNRMTDRDANYKDILKKMIKNDNFHISILEDEKIIYESNKNVIIDPNINPLIVKLDEIGYNWKVKITPVKTYVDNFTTDISEFILFFGFLISYLFGFSLYSQQLKNEKARELLKSEENLKELNKNLEKRIEEELVKFKKQEALMIQQSKLAAMGEMIGSIAHQWRQPLNALAGHIQILKYDHRENLIDTAYLDDYTDKNMKLINFMSGTIDDFRSFFKVDKEKIVFNISDIIDETYSLVSEQFKDNNIEVKIIKNGINVSGYVREFQQVVLNILNNAKDAIVENNIENGKITIKETKSGNKAVIEIEDNGGGIPESVLERVFEPYFTTKEQGSGTGLGLYMSKMIIEDNMDGKLYVKNSLEGALLIIELEKNDV
jgi:signal transduction histidine kinase